MRAGAGAFRLFFKSGGGGRNGLSNREVRSTEQNVAGNQNPAERYGLEAV